MAIKISSKKCFTASHKQSFQKLANYVISHYPKDTNLHKAVRGTFKATDDAAAKMSKAASKKPKRRSAKRAKPQRRAAKRAAPKRRSVKRRTAKRSAPKRRSKRRSMKRAAPKHRRAMRRRRTRRAA